MEDTPIIWGEPPEEYFFEESEPYTTIICNTKEDYDDIVKAAEYYYGESNWIRLDNGYRCENCSTCFPKPSKYCPECGHHMDYITSL